ncbi:NACHT domain-containing protein [Streptomyces sp. SLBN-8D4]|uniref:NACHT domain-containing protein n=1 Tax=Streptomyces sp. SLBN-8D4 TaxID=3377728 RepID=UPI003C7C8D9A
MKPSRTRRPGALYAVLQLAAVVLALWLSKHFQVARLSTTLIALAVGTPAACLAWFAYRDDRREAAADIDAKVKTLAAVVATAETRQRAQLIGPGAHRIDVTFHQCTEPANNASGAATNGRLTDIVSYYQNLRPARLAITGEPGAGKTLLALDLVLGLLTLPGRADTDPVPVRFSLADWSTDQPLQEWLAHRVHQQFRDQGITLADATTLVDRYRVLPILDGLDEMDTDATPVGRRRAARALEQLNVYQGPSGNAPVVLTCRTTQYQDLASLDLRIREAARIQLDDVTPSQATAYLTARSTSPDRWQPVIDTLTTAPSGTLARSLATPWRLNLAATAYEERRADTLAYLREPDHLLTLASPSAVRDHLLARYVPAAAHQHPTHRYRPDQTHHWLAALAAHLTTTTSASTASGTDIVLHQLWPMAGPRRVRTADTLLAVFLAVALTPLLLSEVPPGFSPRQLCGALVVVLFVLGTIWQASRPFAPMPQGVQLQLRSRGPNRQTARTIARWLAFGLAAGLALGLASALVFGFGLIKGLAAGLAFGLYGGAMIGIVDGLMPAIQDRLSYAPPTDPRHPVRDDLTVGLIAGLGVGLLAGIAVGPAGESVGESVGVFWVTSGLAAWLYGFSGAGRRYLVFLLCIRSRLPSQLGTFLNWAYEAGLLRISGVAYQFRHRELQDWLIAHPTPEQPPDRLS